MNVNKLIVGIFAWSVAGTALAGGAVPLGTPLGRALGFTLGTALGVQLGSDLPIASVALLTIAAVSLVVGIGIVRRKKHH